MLSDEEVERRVGVRGGGTPRAPIERPPRVTRPPRREERTTARDSLLLVGLVIVGLVAVRVFLPDGPLAASATSTPSGTQAAIATSAPSGSPGPTIVPVITLPPGSSGPSVGPTLEVTVPPTAPAPTPTLKPGETPRPTPKPTTKPTSGPTPVPTTTPTATVLVKMQVVNDNGGNALPGAWTMKINGEVGTGVSPNTFGGSEAGTYVTIPAGKGFLVSDNNAVAGYGSSASPDCSRDPGVGIPAGTTVTCTITRNDLTPYLNLTVSFSGAQPPNPSLSITGTANPSPSSKTSFGTTPVTLDANHDYQVVEDTPISGYTLAVTGNGCSSTGLALNVIVSCTYTYTEIPPSPASPVPFLLLPILRPRRWRTTATG
ncbi:MAG: hypothetical protein HYX55_08610 [Chloroflexi bacterium]|nr:hypothetical protein [Chloroflexota bacterium]